MLPSAGAIGKFSPVAMVALVGIIGIMIVKPLMDQELPQEWPDLDAEELHRTWPSSVMALGAVTATLSGAFGVMELVPSVISDMSEPMHFPFAFAVAQSVLKTTPFEEWTGPTDETLE